MDQIQPSNYKQICKELGIAVVMPTFNNARTVGDVITEVLEYCDDVIVINDGCTDGTDKILASFGNKIRVKTHPINWGKGTGLVNGLSYAKELGFRYAITIDSDGQHYPSDMVKFIEEIQKEPDSLLVGARNLQADGMPGGNTFANKFSNFWFRLETGVNLVDTQSGYRLYPLEKMNLNKKAYTSGYEFELEALVFSCWDDIKVKNIPIRVLYQPEGERVSHFKPFRDFAKISVLNTCLVAVCFFYRWPKKFIQRYILNCPDSNFVVAASVALGVFCGIIPVWGFQLVTALALAHILKLNKIVAGVASNISIPPMIPFVVFGSYWTGCKLFGKPLVYKFSEMTIEKAGMGFLYYVVGSVIFAIVCGLVLGLLSYLLMKICGRKK